MLNLKRITACYNLKVFTEGGDYFGDVEEIMLTKTKVAAWRIRATKGSYLSKALGNAKGVIVPHNLIKSIGDVAIVSNQAVPSPISLDTDE